MLFITSKLELGQDSEDITAEVEQHIPVVQHILESSQRPEVGWSGPATLKLVGDRDQTEPIAIEAVSCNKLHAAR